MSKSKAYFKNIYRLIGKAVTELILFLIWFYQKIVSPLKPPVCRYYPSCSQYFYEAVKTKGIAKGCFLGIKRVLRCHPFHAGGYDPVE